MSRDLDRVRDAFDAETRAILLAFGFAPLAFGCVFMVQTFVGGAIVIAADVPMENPAGIVILPVVGWVLLTPAMYAVSWILGIPTVLFLRRKRWLTAVTVLVPAALIPTALAATFAFYFWLTRGGNVVLMFFYLAFLIVPGTIAVAAAFWGLFSFLRRRSPLATV